MALLFCTWVQGGIITPAPIRDFNTSSPITAVHLSRIPMMYAAYYEIDS